MWSYYGSKSKIVKYYQKPRHSKIIEPFAGSAKYSMKYFEYDVLLVEKYLPIVKLWRWLQTCSKKDITSSPILKEGDTLDSFHFDCEEQKIFMGFLTAQGVAKPQNKATFRATTHRPNWIKYSLNRISNDIEKIRHWDIVHGDYECVRNIKATWFIDPPYVKGGEHYPEGSKNINYEKLSKWCKERNGQVIVCENQDAEWLPFSPLKKMKGSRKSLMESVWYKS